MNRLFFILSFLMGVIVLGSNYLVQFPVQYYGLEKILTYGAFSYPIAFLITDLANRSFGKFAARKIVYLGFVIGISYTLFFSISFYGTGISWISLSIGDLSVKIFVALIMLIPFKLLSGVFREDQLYKNL